MDDNTFKVWMIAVPTASVLISAGITALVQILSNRKVGQKVDAVQATSDATKTQVDVVKADVNSRMTAMLKMTEEIAKAAGIKLGVQQEKADAQDRSDARMGPSPSPAPAPAPAALGPLPLVDRAVRATEEIAEQTARLADATEANKKK